MATIIFDFDHTLLDSSKVTELITLLFLKNGLTIKTIEAIQRAQREECNDNPGLLEQIKKARELGFEINKKDIEKFFNSNLKKYLKGPVTEVLEKLQKSGHALLVLTKGIEYFQQFKIRQSGLEIYFKDNIYIFDGKKEENLSTLPITGKTYFVNDHADEIEAVAKKYPEMNFIYIKGPKTSHDRFIEKKHIPTIDDISELSKLIKK